MWNSETLEILFTFLDLFLSFGNIGFYIAGTNKLSVLVKWFIDNFVEHSI